MCEEAEHLGIDAIWLTEHHASDDGYLTQPLAFACAVAARTTRSKAPTLPSHAPSTQRVRWRRTLATRSSLRDVPGTG
jgi:alkanesulfonate monooxygenase SsuD/methylene tetrahydromethanopterin reductase-like flavin-dependent oxidoreductase (luciferase family)